MSSATLANHASIPGALRPAEADGHTLLVGRPALSEKKSKKQLVACYFKIGDVSEKTRKRLYAAARATRELSNAIFAEWYAAMVKAGVPDELRMFLEDLRQWRENPTAKGEKPKLEIMAVSRDLQKHLQKMLTERCPELHSRCAGLALKYCLEKIRTYPHSAKLKLWQAALLGHANMPVSLNDLPIRFDRQNAELGETDGQITIAVRIESRQIEGKINRVSEQEVLPLVIPLKAARKPYAQLALEAARGQRPWAGSQIIYNARRRQWRAALVVETDPPAQIGTETLGGVADLSAPETDACWRLQLGERTIKIGGGDRVRHLRTRLARAKEARRADPMKSPNRNGHGQKRLLRDFSLVSGHWNNVTKTLNYQMIARVLRELELAGIKRLRYATPSEKCLLNTAAGECGSAWPLYQIPIILRRKCDERGIVLEILESDSIATTAVAEGSDG